MMSRSVASIEAPWVCCSSSYLAHEPGVSDGVVLFFGASVSVGVAVVPLGSHDAPQESDGSASPDGTCAAFLVRLQVGRKVCEEGFL